MHESGVITSLPRWLYERCHDSPPSSKGATFVFPLVKVFLSGCKSKEEVLPLSDDDTLKRCFDFSSLSKALGFPMGHHSDD
jgi:hypothetical protein